MLTACIQSPLIEIMVEIDPKNPSSKLIMSSRNRAVLHCNGKNATFGTCSNYPFPYLERLSRRRIQAEVGLQLTNVSSFDGCHYGKCITLNWVEIWNSRRTKEQVKERSQGFTNCLVSFQSRKLWMNKRHFLDISELRKRIEIMAAKARQLLGMQARPAIVLAL